MSREIKLPLEKPPSREHFEKLATGRGYHADHARLMLKHFQQNGEAYCEKQTAQEVNQTSQSWHCQVDGKVTTILANFGQTDPNKEMAEINVRESLFMPGKSGLSYITVDGFNFLHAAANWAPPGVKLQMGAVGPRMGKRWIIENCTIINSRCVGIILGLAPGVHYGNIDAFGDHIIRNNIIRRCGQAGIAGEAGSTRSLISGNLIPRACNKATGR